MNKTITTTRAKSARKTSATSSTVQQAANQPLPLLRAPKTGIDLLNDPRLNKGTAFTRAEREKLGLLGLLPPRIFTMADQAARVLSTIRKRATPIERYVDMISLLDRNETLFYRVLMEHLAELMPVVYTPTVGEGCLRYSHLFRRSRGIFLTRHERGRFQEILRHWPRPDVKVIVVTDGERILGLGDLGASGMGIPVGKLSLYTACGGVPPEQTLPVTLDVGTNNQTFLADPLYLGVPERRLIGSAYDELIEEFVEAVQRVFPGCLIQFEDFANHNAFRLLERYRDRVCCFNDDIQGTASVTLAGLYSAMRLTGGRLAEQRLLFHGAGEAAVGIAELVAGAMQAEGLSREQALARCWFMDSKGLVESTRSDLQAHKKPFAHAFKPIRELLAAVRELKPTGLIGVSAQPNQFTQPVIEEMARLNERPIVFALSNPTSSAECTAEQAYGWSKGRAIFASGSPFAPVTLDGRTFVPGQANNAYIFPGVGFGVLVSGARRVTDAMFAAAARSLSDSASDGQLQAGCLFPRLEDIREVSARIACATAEIAYARGLAQTPKPKDLLAEIRSRMYQPEYPRYA